MRLKFSLCYASHANCPNTVLVVINTNIKYPIKTKYYIVNLSARAFQFYWLNSVRFLWFETFETLHVYSFTDCFDFAFGFSRVR